jgi:hypothetical protein
MLSLFRKDFPSSKNELAQALNEAFHKLVQKDGAIADVRSRVFPYLDEIAMNLDGARCDSLPPAVSAVEQIKPAFEVAMVRLSGRNISVCGVPLDIRMQAHDVALSKGANANGEVVLLLQKVRHGQLAISVGQLELEKALAAIAAREAARRGIVLDQMHLAIRACGPRSLAADVHVQARKFLLHARVDISGQIDIDENFAAKVLVKCKSDGSIGPLVCNVLNPIFERLNDKSFSFRSLPLGEIRIHDLRLAVADSVDLTIDFGSEPDLV